MTDMADRMGRHDRRSRRVTFWFAVPFVGLCILMPVVEARSRGFEIWMLTNPLIGIGFTISIVLRELGRPRVGIVVGYGLASLAMLLLFARAAIHLFTETPSFPGVALGVFGLLISGALLVYSLTFARRRYRATQTPPAA